MQKKIIGISLFFALLIAACSQMDDISDAEIVDTNGEFAIPLAIAETSFQELIENFDDNTFITIDADGLIRLRYEGDIETRTSTEILQDAVESLPTLLPITPETDTLPFNSPEELEVDSAVVATGSLVGFGATRSTDMPSVDYIKITLPQARLNGQPLVLEKSFPAGLTALFFEPIDIGGYALIPNAEGQLLVEYEAVDVEGNAITSGEDGYIIGITMENFNFTYLEGYLGQRIHPGDPQTIAIDFFENWIEGEVHFEDPEIRINLENSFGIPTRSVINVFEITSATGQVLPLEAEELNIANNQGIDFEYPSLNEVGEVKSQTFTFNKDNSNIVDILGSQPVALDYDVDARTNPDSLVDVRGFLTDESFYKIQVEVELPMYGWAQGFVATDTFEIDLSDYEEVETIEFKLISENGTALDVSSQAYFVNEDGVVLDSLLTVEESLVAAAPVDEDGKVIEEFSKTTLIPFSAERLDGIRTAKELRLQSAFSTYNANEFNVKVFAEDAITVKVGMKVTTD